MIIFQKDGLTVFQSALWKTTSSVIETNDLILVVDPTWLPHEVQEIQQHVEHIRNGKDLYLLFTHGDFDHIIGYHAFPDAKVIGSKGMQEHPRKQYKLDLIQSFDNEYYVERPYAIEFPTIDIVIEKDGQQLVLGDTTITFYLSPGHTHDGLFTFIEPLGIWITGDYLSDFELPYLFDSAKAYLETLQKSFMILNKYHVEVLVPGHGQATESKEEMERRIDLAKDYLERLINAVSKEDAEAVLGLKKEMSFPSNFTKECHEENVAIIKREYS
ncbi:MBL fold metallo-hydrolase [Paenisporosarcina sp. OV554]|uniref:MBL fold metallo-hydrolase n=1 Tax=Paenisporosarcina sp. OV554 TaxID=2135694 RepID=UPI000D3C6BED|nr:MBL fold metallo-hydrolase [Paenisporosarcina sp. OV554]PUB10460.1 glyoxylase-like metal-dependent hydrolase (beta-lactamase superfamily II) [Paenisporosarcina sp. OV554]